MTRDYVRELGLQPHPEGGFYRQTFKSSGSVQRDGDTRSALTAIYFFLPAGAKSRWHRVTADEIWVHLDGGPLRLWTLDGQTILGDGNRMHAIPAGAWQAAEPVDGGVLVACFVAPGFEFDDFTMMSDDPAARERLAAAAPHLLHLV